MRDAVNCRGASFFLPFIVTYRRYYVKWAADFDEYVGDKNFIRIPQTPGSVKVEPFFPYFLGDIGNILTELLNHTYTWVFQ